MIGPVVILGAGGRLGRLLDSLWPTDVLQYTRADVDILDTPHLVGVLQRAGAVFCFAGVTNKSDQPMSMNVALAQRTLDAARRAQCGRVFLMSSAAIYGRSDAIFAEDKPPAPMSDYGRAKVAMEEMAAQHEHPNSVLRLGNIAGADAILAGWKPGFALDSFESGRTPERSYIGPVTLASVLRTLAAADDVPQVLNVSAPGTVQMGDLLDAAGLPWQRRAATDATIEKVALDTTRLSQLIDLPPETGSARNVVQEWQRAGTIA